MGGKEILEDEEHKNEIAKSILLKSGAIKECENCSDYVNNFDESALRDAYKIGRSMITKGDELVKIFKGDREALSGRIKSVYTDTNWECHCENLMKE